MPFQGQWADALLAAERVHALRLALWAALSILAGSGLYTWVRLRRGDAPLVRHFALQCMAWGAVVFALALWLRQRLALRDLAHAILLDRSLWFFIGLEVGVVVVGLTLAVAGWRLGRRLALVGAGLGLVVQGLALGVLDLQFAAAVIR
jgi:hypothetical protein